MNALKFIRLSRSLTQKEIAALLGVHEITYNRIERGWYARPPDGFEERLRGVFGPHWSFERLMQQVPDLTEPPSGGTS